MANIKLYRNCEIREEKNFAVDDIERYLRDLTPVKEFQDAQYIKQGLDIEVKVKLDQTYLDREWTNMFNYVRIENGGGDDNCCYYFIRDKKWISKEAIKLVLHMDVINTYKDQVKLTNKTTIQREHKDRFINTNIPEQVIYTETDSDEWEWGTGAGELVGFYSLDLSEYQFAGRDVTVTITETEQPHKIASFEYAWDKDFGELKVTAYVQGELSPIPDVEVEITVVPSTLVNNTLYRKIDRVSEGIDTVLFNKGATEIRAIDMYGEEYKDSAYLIYKTADAYNSSNPDAFIYNNAINCFFTTDSGVERQTGTFARVTAADIHDIGYPVHCGAVLFPVGAEGKQTPNSFKYDYPEVRAGMRIQVVGENGTTVEIGVDRVNDKRNKQKCLYLLSQSGSIWVFPAQLKRDNFRDNNDGLFNHGINMGSWISFVGCSKVDVYKSTTGDTQANLNAYDLFSPDRKGTLQGTYEGTVIREMSKKFSDVDRTNQQLVKIVKLPYSPYLTGSDLVWDDTEKMFRIAPKTLNENALVTPIASESVNIKGMLLWNGSNITTEKLRDDWYESKLFHSDYLQAKFTYDSFSYVYKLEGYKYEDIPTFTMDDRIFFNYVVSTSVASTFLFDFYDYSYSETLVQDYPDVMVVNRNLEVPIYNNYYMNYLRNGYNFDVKNKQTSQVATGIGIGLSAASLVAGIALTATGVGSGMGATAIVGGIAGLAGSITGAVVNSVQADRTLQQKLEQAKNQGASVQGADDIGLLSYYCVNNKPQIVTYALSDNTKARLADLFYYCGYKCDYQDVPDTGSRYWFNFVQCNPVYDEDHLTAKMSKDCLDELSTKYGEGITFLHGHYNAEDDETEYDFKQVKENWEVWLVLGQPL